MDTKFGLSSGYVSLSMAFALPLVPSAFLSLSLSLSLSPCPSFSLSLPLSLSPVGGSLCISIWVSVSLFHSTPLCLPIVLSLSLSRTFHGLVQIERHPVWWRPPRHAALHHDAFTSGAAAAAKSSLPVPGQRRLERLVPLFVNFRLHAAAAVAAGVT